jgi:3,4-dihydroxy 2-butanone 4-phosphate synthase/GTP cyclohydrolase II
MKQKKLNLQEARKETGYGEVRDYGIGAQILKSLGVRKIRLLSDHPPKVNAIEAFGLEIVDVEPISEAKSEN